MNEQLLVDRKETLSKNHTPVIVYFPRKLLFFQYSTFVMHVLINTALFSVIFMKFSKEMNASEAKHLLQTIVDHTNEVIQISNKF